MHKLSFRLSCLIIMIVLMLAACNLPVNNTATEVPATQSEKPALATSTSTKALPTETDVATSTATSTPEPSATITPEIAKAEVVRETNCRVGPAGNYDLVATYPVGQLLEVVAKDLGNTYWFVKNPEKAEEQCYLLAQNVKISGDTETLPRFTPQPSPTAAPYFKVSFRKIDTCENADFAVFVVENTGSIPFRSAYIKVTDQKVNKSVEQALNAFDLVNHCVLARNIAPLEPGGTGYVNSPTFKWAVQGHKLRAVIMLCTDKALKGTCVTQTVDVKQ